MKNHDNYSDETGLSQAEIANFIETGKARDVAEAEVMLRLGAKPAEILEAFVGSPLPEPLPKPEAWKRLFQQRVGACLEGGSSGPYMSRLCQTSNTANPDAEKLRLLSAAWIYALENRSTFPLHGRTKYRRDVLLDDALHLSMRQDGLGLVLRNYLSHIPLRELFDTTENRRHHAKYSTLALSEQAFARKSEDPELAEQIIERAILHLFSPAGFSHHSQQLSPEVLEERLQYCKRQHPEKYDEFSRYVAQLLIKNRTENAFLEKLWVTSPTFQACARQGLEQNHEWQQKMQWVDKVINYFEGASVAMLPFDHSWIKKITTEDNPPFNINVVIRIYRGDNQGWSGEDFRADFRALAENIYIPEEKREKLRLISERVESEIATNVEKQKLAFVNGFQDVFRIKNIQTCDLEDQKQKYTKVQNSVEHARKAKVTDRLFSSLLEELATFIREQLNAIASEAERQKEEQAQRDAEEKATILQERQERLREIPIEYLTDIIERQIDYLRQLYSEHTGLDLDDIGASADAADDNGSIGSVMLRTTQGSQLQLRQRQSPRIQLIMEDSRVGIHLEIGDTLEDIEKRGRMVDWVIPHEIAHMVNEKLNNVNEQIVLKQQKSIDRFAAATCPQEDEKQPNSDTLATQVLIQESLVHALRECVIDGLGFKMLRAYGTTDPFDKTEQERIGKAVTGFLTFMEVFQNNVAAQMTEEIVPYQMHFLVLRMFAITKILASVSKKHHLPDELVAELHNTIKKLGELYEELHRRHPISTATQVKSILRLYKECFMKAETISFELPSESE